MVFNDVLIREATPSDAGGILAAMHRILDEPELMLFVQRDEFTTTEAEERAHIEANSNTDNALMLVAEALTNSQIVGVLTCEGESHRARHHITHMTVHIISGWRNRGIGTQLVESAVRWAEKHPTVRRVELAIPADNRRIVTLYTRLGFVFEGRAIAALFNGQGFVDLYHMAMVFNDKPLTHVPAPPSDDDSEPDD